MSLFNLMGMDYGKTQVQIEARRQELFRKLSEIEKQRAHLDEEYEKAQRELLALIQMRSGAEIALGQAEVPCPPIPGLTEHIRNVLLASPVPLTPTDIRRSCLEVGIRGSSRKNLLIAVHSILKRFGYDVKRVQVKGKSAYVARPGLKLRQKQSQGVRSRY